MAEGVLSSFSKDVIISVINKVSYKQLMKQKQTQKKPWSHLTFLRVNAVSIWQDFNGYIIKLIRPVTIIISHWLIAFERSIAY